MRKATTTLEFVNGSWQVFADSEYDRTRVFSKDFDYAVELFALHAFYLANGRYPSVTFVPAQVPTPAAPAEYATMAGRDPGTTFDL